MNKPYYTSVAVIGNNVLYRGVNEHGVRIRQKISDFSPVLFVPSKDKDTEWKTHLGEPLGMIEFAGPREAREFIRSYNDTPEFQIYGNIGLPYQFTCDQWPYGTGDIPWDRSQLVVAGIDIEVDSEDGFPDVNTADKEINCITLRLNEVRHVFSFTEWENTLFPNYNIIYHKCSNEEELLREFLHNWIEAYPDIITGWYSRVFDIPYLARRIIRELGEAWGKKLSPWGMVMAKDIQFRDKMYPCFELLGIAQLDMLQMFQKFAKESSQESYKLDSVAQALDLGKKGDYSKHGSLANFYKQDPKGYIDYNIQDDILVEKIDKKLGLIDYGLIVSYKSRTNFEDVFYPVRLWDTIAYNFLKEEKIAVPPKKDNAVQHYEGAFVKDIILGKFEAVVGYDAKALYPSIIMMLNLSAETILDETRKGVNVESLLEKGSELMSNLEHILAANGCMFRKDKRGFLPRIVEAVFNERDRYKKMSKDAEQEIETTKDAVRKIELKKIADRYGTFEQAMKIFANSLYGATGNRFFRFFDIRIAEAITLTGQYAIKRVIIEVNQYLNKLFHTNGIDYIIASDTDSIYVNMTEFMKHQGMQNLDQKAKVAMLDKIGKQILSPFIQKVCEQITKDLNAYEPRLFMKREAIAMPAIWTDKKRYILRVWADENVIFEIPKIKIKGLEAIKSSTPNIVRKKIKQIIETILTKDNATVIKEIEEFRFNFSKLPPDAVAFPRGVSDVSKWMSMAPNEIYKNGCPIHVRGSILFNHKIKELNLLKVYKPIRSGDKIKFLYLKEPNPAGSHVIAFPEILPPEFELENYVDYDMQFDKVFADPLRIILKAIDWKFEHQESLLDFFS